MARLLRVVSGVLGLVLAVLGGLLFVFTAAGLTRDTESSGMDLFVTGFFLAVALGGLALVRFAWPAAVGQLPVQVLAAVFNREMLFNPMVHALLLFAAATLLLAVSGRGAVLVVLAITTLYAVATPALIAVRPHWWLNAALSIVAGLVLLVLLPPTAEGLSRQHLGEDAMVLLFPMTVFPVALLVSLVVHLLRRRHAHG